ncbi:integrase catalytic domain-containing protein [Trichonephila inaurata madagascariensis]|uniref:Integrase catalytic domain-containing protein n=1 Tax=Trichonephila inaurata madagascariensis TaxID=2747483 RepID=A0A8X6XBF8_9ARAC|nr:integrase catalytic domain-containing protein [Trichonephila inaurata madagascariensis]
MEDMLLVSMDTGHPPLPTCRNLAEKKIYESCVEDDTPVIKGKFCQPSIRFLTYVSDDVNDLTPLTPSMFLHDLKQEEFPDLDILDSSSLNKGVAQTTVSSDNTKRIEWPLAKVMELYPSKDGSIRLVKVKMKSGEFLRPVLRLIPLEVTQKVDLGKLQ